MQACKPVLLGQHMERLHKLKLQLQVDLAVSIPWWHEDDISNHTQKQVLPIALNPQDSNGQKMATYHRLEKIFETRLQDGESTTAIH